MGKKKREEEQQVQKEEKSLEGGVDEDQNSSGL